MFAGCSDPLNWGSQFKPTPDVYTPRPSATSAAPSSPSSVPSSEAPTPTPTPTPSTSEPVTGKASGSMKLYQNTVTSKFSGNVHDG